MTRCSSAIGIWWLLIFYCFHDTFTIGNNRCLTERMLYHVAQQTPFISPMELLKASISWATISKKPITFHELIVNLVTSDAIQSLGYFCRRSQYFLRRHGDTFQLAEFHVPAVGLHNVHEIANVLKGTNSILSYESVLLEETDKGRGTVLPLAHVYYLLGQQMTVLTMFPLRRSCRHTPPKNVFLFSRLDHL